MKITELVNYIASNGGEVELPDGRKVQVTLVEPANPFDTPDIIGKWVRCFKSSKATLPEYIQGEWYEVVNQSRTHVSVKDKKEVFQWSINGKHIPYDLANALDYNPEELVGKWYEGKQIEYVNVLGKGEGKTFLFDNTLFIVTDDNTFDLSKVTDAPPTKSLNYEDVVKKVKPIYYIDNDGDVQGCDNDISPNHIPSKSDAKSVLAYCQLLVVMKAANGDWKAGEGETVYTPEWIRETKSFLVSEWRGYTPAIHFRTRELAEQALKDNEQLFKDFYQIQ